jgi:putative endonuclease
VFYVYVLLSQRSSRYYVGSTNDVSRRVAEHNAGKTTSTRSYRPWRLVYTEAFETLAEARQRERQIKSWKSPHYMEKTLRIG